MKLNIFKIWAVLALAISNNLIWTANGPSVTTTAGYDDLKTNRTWFRSILNRFEHETSDKSINDMPQASVPSLAWKKYMETGQLSPKKMRSRIKQDSQNEPLKTLYGYPNKTILEQNKPLAEKLVNPTPPKTPTQRAINFLTSDQYDQAALETNLNNGITSTTNSIVCDPEIALPSYSANLPKELLSAEMPVSSESVDKLEILRTQQAKIDKKSDNNSDVTKKTISYKELGAIASTPDYRNSFALACGLNFLHRIHNTNHGTYWNRTCNFVGAILALSGAICSSPIIETTNKEVHIIQFLAAVDLLQKSSILKAGCQWLRSGDETKSTQITIDTPQATTQNTATTTRTDKNGPENTVDRVASIIEYTTKAILLSPILVKTVPALISLFWTAQAQA